MSLRTDTLLDALCLAVNDVFACKDVMAPNLFLDVGKCHDWRNYVPEAIRLVWNELSELERTLVMLVAEKSADAEEWD